MDNKRSAIVMGATSGIGYEVALILARRGWRIGVAGRRKDILARMSGEIDGVVSIVDGIERRKPVITINWIYRLLVSSGR